MVFTENWQAYNTAADPLLEVLSHLGGEVGLCLDLGNAAGGSKLDVISKLAPRATSLHVKAEQHRGGGLDHDDLARCLRFIAEAEFRGPASLIAEGWDEVTQLREACERCLSS